MYPIIALLHDTAARVFAREITPTVHHAAAAGTWPAATWAALEEAGLPRVALDEAAGGAGVSLDAALGLLYQPG